jgi:hypothetical protein
MSLEVMLGEIARLSGRRPPKLKMPRAPLFPLAFMAEAVARMTGKEPFLTADALRMSRYRMFFSSAKAKTEAQSQRAAKAEAKAAKKSAAKKTTHKAEAKSAKPKAKTAKKSAAKKSAGKKKGGK